MKYKEALEAVEKIGGSETIYIASIANEVDFFFNNEHGRALEEFEQLCELVSDAYLKVDNHTSLAQVVYSLRELINEGQDINTITHHDIIENIIYF